MTRSLVILLVACSQAAPAPHDSPVDTGDTEPPVAVVVLNELQSSNSATLADEDGDFDDWIELYAPGQAMDVSGWTLADSATTWTLPAGTTVPAGGWLLVWADDDGVGLHASFKLSAEGEAVTLSDADGPVDTITLPAMDPDTSYARIPDGGATWAVRSDPTPGAANPGQ